MTAAYAENRYGVQGDGSSMRGAVNFVFSMFIVYFWALQFLRGDSTYLIPEEISYYLFVFPCAGLFMMGIVYTVMQYNNLDFTSTIVGIFGIIVLIVSAARFDMNTARTIGLLCLSLIVIFRVRPLVSVNLLNFLFLLALPITTALFFLGYSQYTFIPGLGAHPFHWWRISAYPSAAEGGLFALVVLLSNLNYKGQKFRGPFLMLSAYMLILAGNRTAIIAALVCIAYLFLKDRGFLRTAASQTLFVLAGLALFLISVFASQVLFYLPFADTAFVREVILREEVVNTRFDAGDQLASATIRTFIIDQHIGLFRENPLFGAGTFEFQQLTSGYGVLDNISAGTEAYLTALFARVGLPAAILLFAIFLARRGLTGRDADQAICSKVALFIGMVTYGSFVNPYDIVFLLMILGIAGCIKAPQVRARADAVPNQSRPAAYGEQS